LTAKNYVERERERRKAAVGKKSKTSGRVKTSMSREAIELFEIGGPISGLQKSLIPECVFRNASTPLRSQSGAVESIEDGATSTPEPILSRRMKRPRRPPDHSNRIVKQPASPAGCFIKFL
jgi:hypothetical protein